MSRLHNLQLKTYLSGLANSFLNHSNTGELSHSPLFRPLGHVATFFVFQTEFTSQNFSGLFVKESYALALTLLHDIQYPGLSHRASTMTALSASNNPINTAKRQLSKTAQKRLARQE